MITGILGWMLLASVAIGLGLEMVRSFARWRNRREICRNRIVQYRHEIETLRKTRPPAAPQKPHLPAWQGFRQFRVIRKVREADGCHSFYLEPLDKRRLPGFAPGQFLTFSLDLPGESKPLIRCYSLSAAPRPEYYRCTIRHVAASHPNFPPGKASNFFHRSVKVGDILNAKAPRGTFQLNTDSDNPVVLIAAGVGITPVFCMLDWLVMARSQRPVHLFYGVRNSNEHIFHDPIQQLKEQYDHLRVTTFYSQPLPEDTLHRSYDVQGRVSLDRLQAALPERRTEYYMCGPTAFMQEIQSGLQSIGIPEDDLHYEAFGPSTVKKQHPNPMASPGATATAQSVHVVFQRSNQRVRWTAQSGSLLELAEHHGIDLPHSCRTGNCGTCMTALKSGSIEYTEDPIADCDAGSCLPCICVPSESIVIDA